MKSERPKKLSGRRNFSNEFKAEAVKLALTPGQSIAAVARDLGVKDNSLRNRIKQAKIDNGEGPAGALTTKEREELTALRKENKELRMEKEILQKATDFFAKQQI